MKIRCADLFIIFAIITVSFSTLVAQDSSKVHSLEKGAWAFTFQLSGSLLEMRMSDFDGRTFSGKFHPSDNRAWRIGAEIKVNASDNKRTINHILIDEIEIDKSNNSGLDIDLTAQHLWYLRSNRNFHFFVGLGPEFSYYKAKNTETSQEVNPQENRKREDAVTRFNSGFLGSLGVECFIKSNFSFIAEYNTSLKYTIYKSDYDTTQDLVHTNDSISETSSISLYPANIKMGLSFYF